MEEINHPVALMVMGNMGGGYRSPHSTTAGIDWDKGVHATCTPRVSGHTSTHSAEAPWGPTGHAVLVVPYPEVTVFIPCGLPFLW